MSFSDFGTLNPERLMNNFRCVFVLLLPSGLLFVLLCLSSPPYIVRSPFFSPISIWCWILNPDSWTPLTQTWLNHSLTLLLLVFSFSPFHNLQRIQNQMTKWENDSVFLRRERERCLSCPSHIWIPGSSIHSPLSSRLSLSHVPNLSSLPSLILSLLSSLLRAGPKREREKLKLCGIPTEGRSGQTGNGGRSKEKKEKEKERPRRRRQTEGPIRPKRGEKRKERSTEERGKILAGGSEEREREGGRERRRINNWERRPLSLFFVLHSEGWKNPMTSLIKGTTVHEILL